MINFDQSFVNLKKYQGIEIEIERQWMTCWCSEIEERAKKCFWRKKLVRNIQFVPRSVRLY